MPTFYNIIPGIQATAQHQIARSAAFMGIQDFSESFDDLTDETLGTWLLTGSPITLDLTHGPGVWGIPNVAGTFMSQEPPIVANGAVTPWHVAARIRLPTVFAPNDDFMIGMCDTPTLKNFVRVGTHWNANKFHFIFEVVKDLVVTSVLSDIFVDAANFHDLEMWSDGSDIWGNVDNANVKHVCTVANAPITKLSPHHGVIATNNVGGNMALIDWAYAAGGRTPT